MTGPKVWLIGSAVVAVAVYAALWVGTTQGWQWLVRLDAATLSAAYDYSVERPGWVTGWAVFCTVLGPMAFRLAAFVLMVIAVIRRQLSVALFLLVTVVLNGVLIEAAKLAADRPRPDTGLVYAVSTSFPSGHALGVLLGVLALLAVVWPLPGGSGRWWLGLVGAVVVVAVGVGRVVLNVHHVSDVLAGWALGYAFFVVCLLVIPPRRAVTAVPGYGRGPNTGSAR